MYMPHNFHSNSFIFLEKKIIRKNPQLFTQDSPSSYNGVFLNSLLRKFMENELKARNYKTVVTEVQQLVLHSHTIMENNCFRYSCKITFLWNKVK